MFKCLSKKKRKKKFNELILAFPDYRLSATFYIIVIFVFLRIFTSSLPMRYVIVTNQQIHIYQYIHLFSRPSVALKANKPVGEVARSP